MLVSKLRKRLEEPDWRTVLKSLHIVHRLLQQQKDEEGGKIAAEFRSTAKLGQGGCHRSQGCCHAGGSVCILVLNECVLGGES